MNLRKIKIGMFVILLMSAISAQQAWAATEVSTCSVLNTPGEYVLVNNLSGHPNPFSGPFQGSACLIITASSVKLDCNGFSVSNNGIFIDNGVIIDNTLDRSSVGILSNGSLTNVKIENCAVTQYEVGIYVYKNNDSEFKNNNTFNDLSGIFLHQSNTNSLTGNSGDGISLFSSNDNSISGNSGRGFSLGGFGGSSSNNTLTNNSGGSFGVSNSHNNSLTGNSCDMTGRFGDCFSVSNSNNNTFTNNSARGSFDGFDVGQGTGNIFVNNRALKNIIGFRPGPTATGDKFISNVSCLNSGRDIENFGFNNESSDNECDIIYDPWGGNFTCQQPCAPKTTLNFVDGDGDGVASAFTLSASDRDGVAQTVYSIDEGPDIIYTGGEVPIPTGYHTYSTPFGNVSSIFHSISYFSTDNLGVAELRNSGGIEGDFCPQDAGAPELQGCPCGVEVEVEVATSSKSQPKQQPVPGALVEVFDWTDPTSCAAQNRPNDSEFDCDVANSCPTDFNGRCVIGLVCDRNYDVGTQSLQAQGKGIVWHSLGTLSSEQHHARSVKFSINGATTN